MAAAVSSLGSLFDTNTGTHTVTATPAVNDLIVIIEANTGNSALPAPTDNNTDGLGTYVNAASSAKVASADVLRIWVRNALIGSATSTIFTMAPGTSTGGGLQVLKVTGMSAAGLQAVRQVGAENNKAAAGTPAPAFPIAVSTHNPVIGAVFNGTSPATMTPRSSPAYTESIDVGYATPTAGLETAFINSGETATTITWGGTSASAFCDVVMELAFDSSPTVALNAPLDNASDQSQTALLEFTGTDADGDNIRYEIQISSVPI